MIRVRMLGAVDLRAADGTQLHSVLRQPKRLAVLIYLALSGSAFHRRDRLLSLFWPESDEERARRSLTQQIFQLRQVLGRDVIVNRGDDEIGIAENALWSDVRAFDDLIRTGRDEEAMALYGGELLPSFMIDDAPDFERWLDEQRNRLVEAASAACARLSLAAESERDFAKAIQWTRRSIAIQPLSEASHRNLIRQLDASGDRAAALHAFDELTAMLQREFEAEPSAETRELIANIRARTESGSVFARIVQADDNNGTLRAPLRSKRTARMALAAVSIVMIASALVWGIVTVRQPRSYRPPADHVAVLFFNDQSADQDLGYLAEGLTSSLIEQIGQVSRLRVISQNGVRQFRGTTIPLDSIARQLDVGTIVGGSVTRSNNRLRVTVELIDGPSGMVLQSRKLERPDGELFALLDDLSNEVTSFLRVNVGQEVKLRGWRAETEDVAAWQALQNAEVLRAAAQQKEDDGSIEAAIMLLDRADSAAQRALDHDRKFASAYVLRGTIAERRAWLSLMQQPDPGKWLASATQYADRALALDPSNAAAYELRGGVKYWQVLIADAPDTLIPHAELDLRSAIRLGGDRPRAESILSSVLQMNGRFAEARESAMRALEADAYLTDADQIVTRLFETSFELGDDAEAGRWCDEIRRRFGNRWPSAYCDLTLLAWSTHGAPDPRKAIHILENFGTADPARMRAAMRPRLMMLTAAVLGRARMRDSAEIMVKEARRQAPFDVELLMLEAGARSAMSDQQNAARVLREYLQKNPKARPRVERGRVFSALRNQI